MTESIESYRLVSSRCYIKYKRGIKEYNYSSEKVTIYKLKRIVNPDNYIIKINNYKRKDISCLYDFGDYYRVVFDDGKKYVYESMYVLVEKNVLAGNTAKDIMKYYKEVAEVMRIGDAEESHLNKKYARITSVGRETILANFLDKSILCDKYYTNNTLIYPFGLNQSQKKAIENAFNSQISIIQGPPGTGKTQTILNIIANVIIQGKSVAVVSNNNSAIKNILDKLEKNNISFIAALLGNRENREIFGKEQSGKYPNMDSWINKIINNDIYPMDVVKNLANELNEMMESKNRIAVINQELATFGLEQKHFGKTNYDTEINREISDSILNIPSQKLLKMWLICEDIANKNLIKKGKKTTADGKTTLQQAIIYLFRYGRNGLALYKKHTGLLIPYLQRQYYMTRMNELISEREKLIHNLEHYSFETNMKRIAKLSMGILKDYLARKYKYNDAREIFDMSLLHKRSESFIDEYPVILSSTHSIYGTLSYDTIYDYLIVDEASQVDCVTGVLGFACAKNTIIVGDLKQLPNIVNNDDREILDDIWDNYNLNDAYNVSSQSLLSSAVALWKNVPSTLLREHYRCHPKIAGFFNHKFYDGKLIIMTKDNQEDDVLSLYKTVKGNHARDNVNQRQIDVIKEEVLPNLVEHSGCDVGVITPYRKQVEALRDQLDESYEVDTVHKFQGREKKSIILVTVDNKIGKFVDDPNFLNVAVSRAEDRLAVVVSASEENNDTNIGDLEKYIEYNNLKIVNSEVRSIFDLLYKEYTSERHEFLKSKRRISQYDSENIMYSTINKILADERYRKYKCVPHYQLRLLVKNMNVLTYGEYRYASHNCYSH